MARNIFVRSPGLLQIAHSRFAWTAPKPPVITSPQTWTKKVVAEDVDNNYNLHDYERSRRGNLKACIISCSNSKLNHYAGQSYGKLDKIPLASQGWVHRRSHREHFTINCYGPNPSIIQEDADFTQLNLNETIVNNLHSSGFLKPTLIQKYSTKAVLRGENCLIAAETGSGKTISYLAPLIQNVLLHKENATSGTPHNSPFAVIVTPGRELCEQIAQVCETLVKDTSIKVRCVTGGRLKRDALNADYQETDILVASFGALTKLTTHKIYDMSRLCHLVLDEADTLLDDSFNEKLLRFLRKIPLQMTKPEHGIPEGVQVIMASATIPRSAQQILGDVLPYDSFNKITTKQLHRLLPHVTQRFYRLSHLDKPARLLELVKKEVALKFPVIVFSNKADRCDWVSMFLNEQGVSCVNINGAMNQQIRADQYAEYQSGKHSVLSCTDVVSRGLDTTNIHHIINYDVPTNMSDYIHRCGRVGRVGSRVASGLVTTLVCSPMEVELVQKIEFAARKTHEEELPEVNANIRRLIENNALHKKRNIN